MIGNPKASAFDGPEDHGRIVSCRNTCHIRSGIGGSDRLHRSPRFKSARDNCVSHAQDPGQRSPSRRLVNSQQPVRLTEGQRARLPHRPSACFWSKAALICACPWAAAGNGNQHRRLLLPAIAIGPSSCIQSAPPARLPSFEKSQNKGIGRLTGLPRATPARELP